LSIFYFNSPIVGVYYGQCSEICGTNHSFIPIVVETSTLNSFKDWCLTFIFLIQPLIGAGQNILNLFLCQFEKGLIIFVIYWFVLCRFFIFFILFLNFGVAFLFFIFYWIFVSFFFNFSLENRFFFGSYIGSFCYCFIFFVLFSRWHLLLLFFIHIQSVCYNNVFINFSWKCFFFNCKLG